MPVRWDRPDEPQNYAIVCQSATSLKEKPDEKWPDKRYLAIFISGDFTLEEANSFSVEALDVKAVPNQDNHFASGRGKVKVATLALTASVLPQDFQYIVDTFSTPDFIDEYTFFLTKHHSDTFLRLAKEKADLHVKMQERAKRTNRKSIGGDGLIPGIVINPGMPSSHESQFSPLMFD